MDRHSKHGQRRTMARVTMALVAGGLLWGAAGSVAADELKTPVMQQGADREQVQMPRHGQSQQQVRSDYGQPQTVKGPVGDPPITQWVYDDFVVYFEYDHVIHSVKKPE
ncbi:hypothetical protein [Marinobacter bohaiensis]|uniref:hypothetical protein n=1 Tax=Marinobacter bohaiensis TaxID=2201898 RepID=UPI001D178F73|nr:hypothetical protein [Marinobacter bohaiensis]